MASIEGMLGGYWFLKELFWASLLFWCSLRLKPKRLKEVKYLLFVLIVELIICLIWDSFEVPVIGITKRTILSLVFITSGYIYKSTLERKEIRVISKLPIIIVILFCMCCVYSLSIIFPASMNSFDSYTALPLFISGLLGTFSIFLFFKRIYMNHSKLLTLIGDSTLQILTWHFLCFKIVSLFIAWYFCLDIKCIAEFPVIENYAIQGWWFAYFNLGLFLPILFVLTYKKVKHVRF